MAIAWPRTGAMSTEIMVNASTHEARAAVVENGVLQEVFLERASRRGLISNIYKGRVSRVLPGMQAAFIEIGMERTAFLHASDIFDPRHADTGIEPPRTENIRSLVTEGNEILVQVVKDPLGTKGAGEAGNVGALPAVANALVDALSEFGVKHIEMPATPERIWRAMQR